MKENSFLSGWRYHAFILIILSSVLGYFLFTLWGGFEEVILAIKRVGIFGIGIALILSLMNYLLRFFRWQIFLELLHHRVPWIASCRIYIAGFSLALTPGKAGEALRSLFLKSYHVSYRHSMGVLIAERFSDLIAAIVLTSIGLWIYPEARAVVCFGWVLILLFLILLQQDRLLKKIEKLAHLRFVNFFLDMVMALRECFRVKVLLLGTFLGVIAWGAEGVALFVMVEQLGYSIPLEVVMFLYIFALLVGFLSFLPGGLGGTELVLLQLLIYNGVESSDAVALTLAIRLTTLWFAVILGLIVLPRKQLEAD